MFTKKPESGESVTKMGERSGELKTPFTERPATYSTKSSSAASSKMVPSIIGEDLSITGNVTSKGEIQIDGQIQGDIHCGSLLLGDKSQVMGGVVAEDVVVRRRVVGSIRGLRVTLQAQSHVEGDIVHQSLAIEQGACFEGKSRRSDDPLAEVKAPVGGSPRAEVRPEAEGRPEKASSFDSKPQGEAGMSTPRAAE